MKEIAELRQQHYLQVLMAFEVYFIKISFYFQRDMGYSIHSSYVLEKYNYLDKEHSEI